MLQQNNPYGGKFDNYKLWDSHQDCYFDHFDYYEHETLCANQIWGFRSLL